ncbi:unnamed protein product [Microthlaspi erraticum]|uniref:Uncharacterized protein n=1 Tax=Microthlaspi erraticum TaxID=1685480 RepID=A0A6D2HM64_9BRAS|nr:unnamed protein product [Microthlaspi erraticum]
MDGIATSSLRRGFCSVEFSRFDLLISPILRAIEMNPKDRKGKSIAIDDGDETIASIARQMRSSTRPEGSSAERSKQMRLSAEGGRWWTKQWLLPRPKE